MNASDVLQRFGDLQFPLELELGTLAMTIRDVFELKEGAVFRTGHTAGMPFTLSTGGILLAEAELVVVDDKVSIRVSKLLQSTKTATSEDGTN
jgi:flagellar motor switch protein FliN/FliY